MPNMLLTELIIGPFVVVALTCHTVNGTDIPPAPQGNEYILVFVDHFIKWPEAFATVSADTATTARIFIDFWICHHGIPDILISDRGSHFLNDLVEEVNKIFSIEHRLTTAYRPQTNGQVERFNRTLIDRKLIEFERSNEESSKLSCGTARARWQGPFVIIDKVNANLYQLENDRGFPLAQLIHVSRLKEYYPRTPEVALEIAAGDTFDPSLEPKGTLDTKEERHQRWEEKQGRKRENRKREIEKYEEVPSLTRDVNGGIDPRDGEWQPPTTPEPTRPPETTRTTTQVVQSTRATQPTHNEADSDADLPTTGADSAPTKAVTAPTTNTGRPT
ncbi:retrotransposable element [Pelomyxa schiedti]|nr:retrotransposable element [Pelomyxa schiedti]